MYLSPNSGELSVSYNRQLTSPQGRGRDGGLDVGIYFRSALWGRKPLSRGQEVLAGGFSRIAGPFQRWRWRLLRALDFDPY